MSFFGSPYKNPTPNVTTAPVPYPYTIPARKIRTEEDPRPHCNKRQVGALLLGTNLDNFRDCNGTLDTFEYLVDQYIQEVTDFIVLELRNPYDWCFYAKFYDGNGGNVMTLPHKNIKDVTTCYIRILPSNVWYHFARIRKLDGSEQERIGGQEPYPSPPETFPVNIVAAAQGALGPIYPTGVEDADLMLDTRASRLIIPPRVLYAGFSLPLWNYNFVPGDANIEVHYTFGFPPTKYQDGSLLKFDPVTGLVNDPSPGTASTNGASPIDWSSGIPAGVSMSVAKLVANRIRRQKWYGLTNGLSSLSVDGASESYGGEPYGGALTKEDESIVTMLLAKYAKQMVL